MREADGDGSGPALGVPLAATLSHLRRELSEAMRSGRDEALRFRIEHLEVELTVTISTDVEGGGGLKFWVIDASGKHTSAHSNTHKLKLTLAPVSTAGGEVLVSGESEDRPRIGR
jgi:hypothetical protein